MSNKYIVLFNKTIPHSSCDLFDHVVSQGDFSLALLFLKSEKS